MENYPLKSESFYLETLKTRFGNKFLKREVRAKERSFSIGTSSEFQLKKRDRNYQPF